MTFARIRRGRNRRQIWAYVVVSVYGLLTLGPLLWILLAAFKTPADIASQPPPITSFEPTLDNFREVFENSDFFLNLGNSVVAAGLSTIASLTFGFLAAYAFARLRRRRHDNLLYWILTMRMVPPLAVVVPFYSMANTFNLFDTQLGLALVYTTFNLPIVVWLMLGYLEKIPVSLEQAAMTDGASRLGAITRVVLPLAAPGLFATGIVCMIFSWNEFAFALNLTGENAKTLPVFVLSFDTSRGIAWGPMAASAVLVVAPVIMLAMIFQRWLVSGLTLGATK